jgi:acetolactate decarboxylase
MHIPILRLVVACVVAIVTAGCAQRPGGVVFQNSTIDALLDGNYDGEVSFEQLRRHGDFGLGTLNELDGEMLALGGEFYQIRSDGLVIPVAGETLTPFGVVTFFRPEASHEIAGATTFKELQARLDSMRPSDGHAYAFRVDGRFASLRARSVPRQNRPYARLAEVVKGQSVFEMADVEGTLVGFWYPESMRHVNVPGYHFHFITTDRTAGGHVLDLTLASGRASVQSLPTVQIALPHHPPATQPAGDRSDELEQVEK